MTQAYCLACLSVLAFSTAACSGAAPANSSKPPQTDASPAGLQRIQHLVVIVLENWSFDSLYAEFDGAEGLTSAMAAPPQIDPASGQPYAALPQVEPLLPATLPNGPFALDPYLAVGAVTTMDLTTKFYEEQQIHGGTMDLFVAINASKGLTMGYFHTSDLPLAVGAKSYVLCDHFHHAVFGGSMANHVFMISAAVMQFPNPPPSMLAVLDSSGNPTQSASGKVQDGPLTPDGYAVNTVYSVNSPHVAGVSAAQLLPAQTLPTIGDELSAAGIDWAWYAGGWNDALAGNPDAGGERYQYQHQPFYYFANYADGTPGRAAHLKDETDFMAAVQGGTMPAVAFVKPAGVDNEHPQYANVLAGEEHVLALVNAIRGGPQWASTAIVVTYDENGGFWDHVSPPTGDKWGPGTRVPTMVLAPFAKRGFVDHTAYDSTSITATIEHRWGLAPLGTRDAAAVDLTNAFQ